MFKIFKPELYFHFDSNSLNQTSLDKIDPRFCSRNYSFVLENRTFLANSNALHLYGMEFELIKRLSLCKPHFLLLFAPIAIVNVHCDSK